MSQAKHLLQDVRNGVVIADTGYDSNELREQLRRQKTKAVISSKPERKRKRPLERTLFRQRYKVECFFFNIKRFRAVATRYDKGARNFASTVAIACIHLWLN